MHRFPKSKPVYPKWIVNKNKMEYIKLNDGNQIPFIGFGTYKATEEEGIASVKLALEKGYRLIDSAARYGNEAAVGKGIQESGVSRDEIIVTTKVWRDSLGYESTRSAFEDSLKKLQLDYLDIYLIHWPANAKNFTDWQEVNAATWRALEDLQQEGKVRSIGVSNFWPEHLDALLQNARVVPAINQIEFHPGYWQPDVALYCQDKGIVLEGWSPLARGKVFENELLKELANKYGKSISQICLQWCIAHDVVPIPKSTTETRIVENLDIFDFKLTAEDIQDIDQLPEMGFSGELPNEWPDRV